ncbi:MAG: HNH endonuclease [Fimbriiglobus sp.]
MSVYIPVALQRQIREHFRNCCAYCRTAEELTATTFEFEHIMPSSQGGETVFENLCLACPMCNRFKSDLVSAHDDMSETEVALFHPHQDRWVDHFAWNNGCTQMIGLTSSGRATISQLRMNRPQMIRVRRMWVEMSEHPPNFDDLTPATRV